MTGTADAVPEDRVEATPEVGEASSPVDSEAAAPEPAGSVDPASSAAGALSVSESGVGTGIRNRELVGGSSRFREGDTVWFWTRVLGGAPGDRIEHVWLRDGRRTGAVDLRIGASHWRTQSNRTLRRGSAGRWVVEARDPDGRLLASHEFVCVEAD